VLNNPHKRQAPPKAHSSLPAVVPADLPRVRRKDFDSYLRAITPEWERFERNAELGREGVAQIGAGPSTPRASLTNDDTNINNTHSNFSSLGQGKAIPPLDTVPPVFFQPNFNLGDPRTFDHVTEQHLSSGSDDDTDPTALSHSLPLLEKFSHYADTVEQHLILEISRRSTSFFAALTNLHDLRSESEQCLARIAKLRTLLTNLDENSAKRGLEVVRREARVANLARVTEGVKVVGGVVEMGKVARGLVGAGQWGEALGVIEEMEESWNGSSEEREPDPVPPVVGKPRTSSLLEVQEEPELENGTDQESTVQSEKQRPQPDKRRKSGLTPSVRLSALHAYSSLPDHLRALTMEIASSLSSELVSVLKVDLVERINRGRDGRRARAGLRDANGVKELDWLDQGLRDRLRPLLQGLVRTRGLKEGMLSWREVVLGEVRAVVKQVCNSFGFKYARY
jgi:vacuolar protein sorting-associated protein 54